DQREWMERQLEDLRVGPLSVHDVDVEVFDRGVEVLLDDGREAVDLVDEEHVVGLELGEERSELPLVLDGGRGGRVEGRASLLGDDQRERGLPETGRAAEEHVVDGIAAPLRRLDEDAEVLLDLSLADEFLEARGPEADLVASVFVSEARIDGSFGGLGHGQRSAARVSRKRDSSVASSRGSRLSTARSTSARLYPMFTSAETTDAGVSSDVATPRTARGGGAPVASGLSRRSSKSRSTSFLPTPA